VCRTGDDLRTIAPLSHYDLESAPFFSATPFFVPKLCRRTATFPFRKFHEFEIETLPPLHASVAISPQFLVVNS